MRRQLLLTIALATFGLSLAVGTVNAQGNFLLGLGSGSLTISLPEGTKLGDLTAEDCALIEDPELRIELECPEDEDEGDEEDPDEDGGGGDGGNQGSGKAGPGNGGRGQSPPSRDRNRGGNPGGNPGGERKPSSQAESTPPTRTRDGRPTKTNPTLTIAEPGAAPIGVPNFVIDNFSIPPFLLNLYQACGTEYGIPWQVLASINRIETNFGQNLNVSYAGAVGWMQFMPPTWEAYGVDANGDGRKDPYNPYDAICSAANYLKASGWEDDPRGAIFAYNRADWYVDEVLLYARQYGRLPDDLIGSLTGLTEGARFPVAASARYADDISEREAARRAKPRQSREARNVADVISSSPTRRGINIYTREGAPVVAVNDGVIVKVGRSERLGRHVVLRDAYGNRFTYAGLGRIADVYPVAKRSRLRAEDFELIRPKRDRGAARAERSAAAGDDGPEARLRSGAGPINTEDMRERRRSSAEPRNTEDARERLYAFPERPRNAGRADLTGQLDALLAERFPGYEGFQRRSSGTLRFDPETMEMRDLEEGSKVLAGTVLGRVGKTSELASHLHFGIRPAGRGAPRIDPKPILDGWKLLEATAIYRAAGENPFTRSASTSQVLLMSKPQLVRRVLADPRLEIYSCGRDDIRTGQIDRRVLASLAYLSERGFRLTVTSLRCGRSSIFTASGGVSHHVSGNAVDIARINGLPVLGNQGPGSVTEALVRDTMRLQGAMAPDQIISLLDFGANTFAMGDHADHVHIGYRPLYGDGDGGRGGIRERFSEVLKPDQWERLIERIGEIDNPDVRAAPSRFALPAEAGDRDEGRGQTRRRASTAGE